jgi:hypothetical protein
MSASHIYANLDLKQYFDVGLFGTSDNHKDVGCGPGARALGLLCNGGTWANSRIAVLNDYSDEYEQTQQAFLDISIEAELMLLDTDKFRWVEDSIDTGILAFAQLCRFALFLDRKDVIYFLDSRYGRGKWHRKFDEHCKMNSPDFETDLILAARDRNLQI